MIKLGTGERIADVARALGLHPVAPDRMVPEKTMCAIATNGDCFDLADVFEELTRRVVVLEMMLAASAKDERDGA